MKNFFFLILFIAGVLQSNAQHTGKIRKYNNKKISTRNYLNLIYSRDSILPYGALIRIKPSQSFWGMIQDEVNPAKITPDKNDTLVFTALDTIKFNGDITGDPLNYVNSRYFPETFYPHQHLNRDTSAIFHQRYFKRIKYRDYKLVFQAITIPFKFRKPIDTLPYNVESGFNLSFGGGLKWGINWYHPEKNILGLKTTTLSFTPGIMTGFGTTSVDGGKNASAGFKSRNEPIFSYGTFFMIGLNNISLGFAIGKDVALKDAGKAGGWIYNHKTWTGFILGLDIIK